MQRVVLSNFASDHLAEEERANCVIAAIYVAVNVLCRLPRGAIGWSDSSGL